MPRIALQLTPELIAAACEVVGIQEDQDIFGDSVYAVVKVISPTEFHFKLVNEDEIVEAVKNDSNLQISEMICRLLSFLTASTISSFFKLVNEDEIVEAVKNDSNLQIISL